MALALQIAWAQDLVTPGTVSASAGDSASEPNGRGVQLLGGREAILQEQSERARRTARARGLALYRLLRVAAVEHAAAANGDAGTGDGAGVSARAVALATAVLGRDLAESRSLRAELERVRAERAALPERITGAIPPDAVPLPLRVPGGLFLRPVQGPLVTPFGVGRDAATGAWIFRAAASFAASPGEIVRSPLDARVARVADSVAGGVAIVLSRAGVDRPSDSVIPKGAPSTGATGQAADEPWTVVLSGLASAAVAPGETVHCGDAVGTARGAALAAVRVETWRGRSPVDPAAVLRAR